jgi:hypothetical protein
MDDLCFYIAKLELIAFFSAFPMFYFLIKVFNSRKNIEKYEWIGEFSVSIVSVYVVLVLLYIGMILNQVYLQSSLSYLNFSNSILYLKCWIFLGIFFLFKPFKLKPKWTLLHSLPFTIIVFIDFISFFLKETPIEVIRNEMQLYFMGFFASILLFLLLSSFNYFRSRIR